MKRRRLKKEVKEALIIIALLIFGGVLIVKGFNRINRIANMCDIEKGHTCTLYEVQEYARQLGGK